MVQRLTWLVPLVLLQGCAGTPLAERLETSFGAQDAALLTAPDKVVESQAARSVQANPTGSVIKDSVSPAADLPDAETSASNPIASDPIPSDSPSSKPPSSNQPQEPYRITIRLSGADPAAPAEAVTRVLRNADVSFAVERIERIQP
ncbi:MAG: hypothetical protein ISQ50_01885 [Synechococcus sp. BS307-5m-G36]|nr:hypothetical protein [Synechococcus sp. BS307-5m-G36]MBL6879936.1 hypothetical protein [Synechococcus sp. BS30m-G31]